MQPFFCLTNSCHRLSFLIISRKLSATTMTSKRVFDFPSYLQHGSPISAVSNKPIIESELPDAVTVLTKPKFLDTTLPHGKCSVYLIGSNHISIKSQNDIERTIKSVDPNVIMLELCIKRTDILSDYITEERFKQPQKQKGTFVSTIYSAIKNARKTDGRDFWAAYRVANKNCPIVLGDRIGDINRQRLASVITFTEVFRYVTLYLKWIYNGGLNQEKIDDRLLEKLQQDCPRMWKVWVKERDVYMTFVLQTLVKELIGKEKNNLDNRSAWRIVAVVGMGHVKGICENWNSTVVLPPDLMEMPPSSIQAEILKVLSWIGRKAAIISIVLFFGYLILLHFIKKLIEIVVNLGKP